MSSDLVKDAADWDVQIAALIRFASSDSPAINGVHIRRQKREWRPLSSIIKKLD